MLNSITNQQIHLTFNQSLSTIRQKYIIGTIMAIEIAPEEYWKKLEFNDARLYLFSLVIDNHANWRFPTRDEWLHEIYDFTSEYKQFFSDHWLLEDLACVTPAKLNEWRDPHFITIPVRDI